MITALIFISSIQIEKEVSNFYHPVAATKSASSLEITQFM